KALVQGRHFADLIDTYTQERRMLPRGMGAGAHGEVRLGALVLFR
nr:hypothetical protein [Tanacetum cinerariifolium]